MKAAMHEIYPCETAGRYFDDSSRTASTPLQLAHSDSEIDERAAISVLQFGAIVPPLSPWRGIHRFLPGYRYQGTVRKSPVELPKKACLSTSTTDEQASQIEQLLDAILIRYLGDCHEPVLLFSGGVDSGIIASRLAALGYRNARLVNFSFSDDDPESQVAEAMARRLGLRFERVKSGPGAWDCLAAPGRLYPQPFGDHSTPHTAELAHSIVESLSNKKTVILDGTGADGAFGMSAKIHFWERIQRIPSWPRLAGARIYGQLLWHKKGRVEHIARILRRSTQMPLVSAAVAQNPLAGIFYSDSTSGASIHAMLDSWVEGWAGKSLAAKALAADLALTCTNVFAQKAQSIFTTAGHTVLYPFLEPEMLAVALASANYVRMEEPKAPLKRSLARHVPHDMVYRRKSGFADPRGAVFFNDDFLDQLRAAAEPTGPISHLLDSNRLIRSCDLLARKKRLPAQTLNLLWAVVFMDRWYRTALPT